MLLRDPFPYGPQLFCECRTVLAAAERDLRLWICCKRLKPRWLPSQVRLIGRIVFWTNKALVNEELAVEIDCDDASGAGAILF